MLICRRAVSEFKLVLPADTLGTAFIGPRLGRVFPYGKSPSTSSTKREPKLKFQASKNNSHPAVGRKTASYAGTWMGAFDLGLLGYWEVNYYQQCPDDDDGLTIE
jgi:hypothetical protein